MNRKQHLQHAGLPQELGGYQIVSIKSPKKMSPSERTEWEGFIDTNTNYFNESNKLYNLGLISSWTMQGVESYPSTIADALKHDAEIQVDGFNGGFTFEKPFYDIQQGLRTTASSADQAGPGGKIGQDQTHFIIYLSEKTYPNDVLATDLAYNSNQIVVVNTEQAELSGTTWKTTVKLTNPDPEASYPAHLLEPNVRYHRIDHSVNEYTTQFTGVEDNFDNGFGTIKAEFRLAGARGVEGYVTGFADAKKNFAGRTASPHDTELQGTLKTYKGTVSDVDPTDLLLLAKPGANGKFEKSTARATTYMEYAVERTLMRRTARAHMWAAYGQFTDENGAVRYINEGLWHQFRRGHIIEYSRPGGITRYHIHKAVNYLYQNNPNLDWKERKVKFKGGKFAYDNMIKIFQDEAQALFQSWANMTGSAQLLGNQGLLPSSPISGPLDALKLGIIQFAEVPIQGIAGSVTVEHDTSLDYMPGTDYRHVGNNPRGLAHTAHTLLIYDTTDQSVVNNRYKLPEGKDVEVYNKRANVYLVRPEGNMVYKGRSNGRWDMGKASDIISSSKYIAQEFWAFNSSAMWLRDPSRVVMIELAPEARTGSLNHIY